MIEKTMPNDLSLLTDMKMFENDISDFVRIIDHNGTCIVEADCKLNFISSDFETYLYKTITNLILISINIYKAEKIRYCIKQNKKCLILLYGDNGNGFDDCNSSELTSDKHAGLSEIIESIGRYKGLFSLRSRSGEGFLLEIVFDNNELTKPEI